MTQVSYIKDGSPYDANGQVIVTITGHDGSGPLLGTGPNDGIGWGMGMGQPTAGSWVSAVIPGGGASGNAADQNIMKKIPEFQAGTAPGATVNLALVFGQWGLTLFRSGAVASAVSSALSRLFSPPPSYAGQASAAPFATLAPAKEETGDPALIPRTVTLLPLGSVTGTAPGSLPQQGKTGVQKRVADIIQNGKQYLAVTGGIPAEVPVVSAQPLSREKGVRMAGVFSAPVVPGMPNMVIRVSDLPPYISPAANIVTGNNPVSPSGFTVGMSTHDAIIRFPNGSGISPVYISVTDIMTEKSIRHRQEEETRRLEQFDASHSQAEVAARQVQDALQQLQQAVQHENEAVSRQRDAQARFNNAVNLVGQRQNAYNQAAQVEEKARQTQQRLSAGASSPPSTPQGHGWQAAYRQWIAAQKLTRERKGELDAAVQAKAQAESGLNAANAALSQARAEHQQKEQAKQAAEQRVRDEKARQQEMMRQQQEADRRAREVGEKSLADSKTRALADAQASKDKQMQDALKITADFYKEAFNRYGKQAAVLAQALVEDAQGKALRSVDDALTAFDKFQDVLNKKFSVADREMIATALASLNYEEMAKNLSRWGKGFGYLSAVIDGYDAYNELVKALETGNWRPLFVKLESIGAGMAATAIAGWVYAIFLGVPAGALSILGFALLLALLGALINDERLEEVNRLLGG